MSEVCGVAVFSVSHVALSPQPFCEEGDCDGTFHKKRFFHCSASRKAGVFTPISHLHRRPPATSWSVEHDGSPQPTSDPPAPPPPLAIGERIVWISDCNKEELGVVRWTGPLPGKENREVHVGVEFVSASHPSPISSLVRHFPFVWTFLTF